MGDELYDVMNGVLVVTAGVTGRELVHPCVVLLLDVRNMCAVH